MKLIIIGLVLKSISVINGEVYSTIYETVFAYLDTFNDIHINSVFVVSNQFDSMNEKISHYCNFWGSPFLQNKFVSFLYIEESTERLQNVLEGTKSALIIVLKGNYESSFENILVSMPSRYFEDNAWILIGDSVRNTEKVIRSFTLRSSIANKLNLNTQIYFFIPDGENSKLFEAFRQCNQQAPLLRKLVTFLNGTVELFDNRFIWVRRKDLTGCKIEVVYLNSNTFHEDAATGKYNDRSEQEIILDGKRFHGIQKKYLAFLRDAMNFSVSMVHAKDNTYGFLDPQSGKWNGIVKILSHNDAEMSVNLLSITQSRSTVIKYSIPFNTVKYQLFLKKPKASPNWGTFFNVFNLLYWMILASMVLLCILCLFFVAYLNGRSPGKPVVGDVVQGFTLAIVTTCKAMVTYDVNLPNENSTTYKKSRRFVLFVVCFFGMMTYFVYNSGLIASLMVQKYEAPIKDLEDFIANPEYQLLVPKGWSAELYFSQSPEDSVQRVWSKIIKDGSLIPNIDAAEAIIKEDPKKSFSLCLNGLNTCTIVTHAKL